MSWYPADIPSQAGRRALVTGANAGLGFFTAARLAAAGAQVTLSGRSLERLADAAGAIRSKVPDVVVDIVVLDTSSLDSVEAGAAELLADEGFDIVVLNAGMVHTPRTRLECVDGHELVLATNVLGHFALLARMFPTLPDGARVVTIGSLSTRLSDFRADDLELRGRYDFWQAYAQSKIAACSVALELDRRLRGAGLDTNERGRAASSAPRITSVIADPGYAISGRTPRVAGVNEPTRGARFADALQGPWAQGKHRGAEVLLHAATAADVEGGQYWRPAFRTKGAPVLGKATRTVRDPDVAARVWAFAEAATGVEFEVR